VAHAEDWCDGDPPIYVQAHDGSVVVLHVTNSALGQEHLPAVERATIVYTSEYARRRGSATETRVTVTVEIPNDRFARRFPVRTLVASGEFGAGTVYARAEGKSGQPMTMRFTLTDADLAVLPKADGNRAGQVGTVSVRTRR
jgi:hypothetical protein